MFLVSSSCRNPCGWGWSCRFWVGVSGRSIAGLGRGVFGPGGGPIFMHMFALTLFRGFGVVVLYQTAVFEGIFGGLVDHE